MISFSWKANDIRSILSREFHFLCLVEYIFCWECNLRNWKWSCLWLLRRKIIVNHNWTRKFLNDLLTIRVLKKFLIYRDQILTHYYNSYSDAFKLRITTLCLHLQVFSNVRNSLTRSSRIKIDSLGEKNLIDGKFVWLRNSFVTIVVRFVEK